MLAKIPVYFIWINKSSFLTYAYAGLMQSELQGLQVRRRRGAAGLMQSDLPGTEWYNFASMWAGMWNCGICSCPGRAPPPPTIWL